MTFFKGLAANRSAVLRLVSLSIAGVMLSACATSLGPQPIATASVAPGAAAKDHAIENKAKPVKMAMLLPLGGFDHTALVAKAMKQAGEMALFELDNPSIQLIVKDDKGTPEGARAATEEAIKEGAEVILGPLFSKSVAGAAAAARPAQIPVIAFSNDRKAAGNGVYLMSFMAEAEVERIVSYAAAQGKKRIAALIPDDAYGQAITPAFREAVARAGGQIVDLQTYPVQANGMLDAARRSVDAIKEAETEGAPVDALFIPGGPDTLPQLGPVIAYSGLDTKRIKLLGTGIWDFPNIGRDEAFVGGWYPSPDPRGWRDFSERFAKTFGQAPPRIASLAYDAVGVAVNLSSAPIASRYTAASLTLRERFRGGRRLGSLLGRRLGRPWSRHSGSAEVRHQYRRCGAGDAGGCSRHARGRQAARGCFGWRTPRSADCFAGSGERVARGVPRNGRSSAHLTGR